MFLKTVRQDWGIILIVIKIELLILYSYHYNTMSIKSIHESRVSLVNDGSMGSNMQKIIQNKDKILQQKDKKILTLEGKIETLQARLKKKKIKKLLVH